MKVDVKGVIVSDDVKWIYDWFGISAVCPKDISAQLEAANGEDLEVEINSGGGDVYAGSEIYTAIKSYKGNSTGKIMGMAASAASVIAMAVKNLQIAPTAQFMIHNVSSGARGDYRAMEHAAEVLKNYNISIANAYLLKTGMTQEELLSLMDKETYFNAQQALKYGFVDEVMFDEESKLVASSNNTAMLPLEVINKIRNHLKSQPGSTEGIDRTIFDFESCSSNIGSVVSALHQAATSGDEAVNAIKKEKVKGENPKMEIKNVDELRTYFPELVNQIENVASNEGREEGKTAERARLKGIDEISNTISEDLLAKAKYEEPITAQELAFQALKVDAAKGKNYLNQRQQEINNSGTDGVKSGDGSNEDITAQEEQAINNIAKGANERRGK